jgi:hypothetical protein
MFKSIQYLKYLGHDPKTNLCSYIYKIIDDDFEEELVNAWASSGMGAGTPRPRRAAAGVAGADADAVINCYSKRNLNVPKNLLLLFMFNEKLYGSKYHNIQQQISYCMKYQSLFPKYKEEVEKYLILI